MEEIRGSKVLIVHLRGDSPSSKDHDPRTHSEHFIDLGRNHDHAVSLLNEFLDEAVDLLLCASINSASGFIQEEKSRLGFERPSEHDLLLISTAHKANLKL